MAWYLNLSYGCIPRVKRIASVKVYLGASYPMPRPGGGTILTPSMGIPQIKRTLGPVFSEMLQVRKRKSQVVNKGKPFFLTTIRHPQAPHPAVQV